MISNRERTTLLSSLGWVDGDAIWCFDAASGSVRIIPQNTGARYTSLHCSDTERFVAVHHFDGARFMASVGVFSAPEITVASATYENGRTSLTGNASAWDGLPRLYVTFLKASWNDHVLVRIEGGHVHIQRLEWYDASYDKGYQAPVEAIALPDSRHAVISVSRSSELVLHDLDTGRAIRNISLAGRHGNPKLALRGSELWATDYDTLVVVDTSSWRVVRRKTLEGSARGARQFIGEFTIAADGSCCVARPFSGDVVALDDRLKIRRQAMLGAQPLETIALPGGDVIARDWKTGELLRGPFEKYHWLKALRS